MGIRERDGEYSYLWQVVGADLNHWKEMKHRITLGWRGFGKQSDAVNSRRQLLSLKRKVYTVDAYSR